MTGRVRGTAERREKGEEGGREGGRERGREGLPL